MSVADEVDEGRNEGTFVFLALTGDESEAKPPATIAITTPIAERRSFNQKKRAFRPLVSLQRVRDRMKTYLETFGNGPAGWWGWSGNEKGLKPLEWKAGTITSRSPWWIDYNHAPPGAGYLHMVACLNTKGPFGEHIKEVAGPNGFVASGCPRNFTNAKLTVRIKGELIENGARLVLLVQAAAGDTISGWLLNGQPFRVTKEWSDQTITLVPDEKQWTCLGGRHDRTDYYMRKPLAEILCDVNVNIMLIMFPLTIAPMGAIAGDPHILRPERDYPVWRSKLPEGYVTLDTVKIDLM